MTLFEGSGMLNVVTFRKLFLIFDICSLTWSNLACASYMSEKETHHQFSFLLQELFHFF